MRRTSRTLTALVAACTVLSFHAGIASATGVSEADASSSSRPRNVARSSKPRSGGRWNVNGTTAAVDLAVEAVPGDLRTAGMFQEAYPQEPSALSTVGVLSAEPLVAVMRSLLEAGGGVQETGSQVCPLLTRVADAMLEGLTVCDDQGTIVYVNSSLCRMLGTTRAELIGRSVTECFAGMYARFVQVTARPSGVHPCERFETEWHNKSGGSTIVKVAVHSIGDSGGEPVGFFAVVRDFTARTRAETALRRSESELRLLSAQLFAAQETERRRIARGLHDGVSQALGGIKFALESCVARLAIESTQASARTMHQLIGKVQAVIEDSSRIAMGLHPSVLDHLGIGPTIDWFCRESSANYPQIRLEYAVDVCEEEIAAPVKVAIYRIIQETFNNAVTHAQASRVTLNLKHNRGHVELSVHDDGVGFDPAQFKSVDKTGRGLGLASMRERAEATAGRFGVESRSGDGTTVKVTWPRHCPRVEVAASEAVDSNAVPTVQA